MNTTLDTLKPIALRAWHGTSFTPERRGERFLKEHTDILAADIALLPPEAKERYISKFTSLLAAYLHSHSNVMSTMITGASNFPTHRNRKRGNWADNKYNVFLQWRERFFKAVEKQERKAAIIEGGGELEIARRELVRQTELHAKGLEFNKIVKKAINEGVTLEEFLNRIKHFEEPEFEQSITRFYPTKEFYFCFFYTVNSNARIKRLQARVNELERREQSAPKATEGKDGIKVVVNTPINRLQIFFPGKPDEETRSKLKHNRFRWTPSAACWQAYINGRSIEVAKTFIQ